MTEDYERGWTGLGLSGTTDPDESQLFPSSFPVTGLGLPVGTRSAQRSS